MYIIQFLIFCARGSRARARWPIYRRANATNCEISSFSEVADRSVESSAEGSSCYRWLSAVSANNGIQEARRFGFQLDSGSFRL